jgi:hypothetical protein
MGTQPKNPRNDPGIVVTETEVMIQVGEAMRLALTLLSNASNNGSPCSAAAQAREEETWPAVHEAAPDETAAKLSRRTAPEGQAYVPQKKRAVLLVFF